MKYTEEAWTIESGVHRLLGIATLPMNPAVSATAVIVVVGGPQYRVGSHRQFVLLARTLANAGFPVLRFDNTGMGDSTGDLCGFEQIGCDIAAACNVLAERQPHVRSLVLWGLCDGASAALMYCEQTRDPRVAGLCLLNPWTRSDVTLARTRVKYYYLHRVLQREFWVKLIIGGVSRSAVREFFGNLKKSRSAGNTRTSSVDSSPFQERMLRGWLNFKGQILLVLSGNDYTAKEFVEYTRDHYEWQRCLKLDRVRQVDLPAADHTFSSEGDRRQVEQLTAAWLQSVGTASGTSTPNWISE